MKVLIACEESQTVCQAFRAKGHEAYSCDLQPPSGGHPEWHIKRSVLPILEPKDGKQIMFRTMDGEHHFIDKWDLLIAHPPCTYLANSGAKWLMQNGILNEERYALGLQGKDFFMKFYNADIEHICVENPVPSKIYQLPPYTQIIQPTMFGETQTKRTCLWLKNLPLLQSTDIVEASSHMQEAVRSPKQRAKTFPGIAIAMADQWGNLE